MGKYICRLGTISIILILFTFITGCKSPENYIYVKEFGDEPSYLCLVFNKKHGSIRELSLKSDAYYLFSFEDRNKIRITDSFDYRDTCFFSIKRDGVILKSSKKNLFHKKGIQDSVFFKKASKVYWEEIKQRNHIKIWNPLTELNSYE